MKDCKGQKMVIRNAKSGIRYLASRKKDFILYILSEKDLVVPACS